MNRSHASRGWGWVVAVVIAMVAVGLTPLTMSTVASAAQGDVGTQGPQFGAGLTGAFIDPDNSPTASKPQSKLWYAQGKWWGVLLNGSSNAFHIYSFDAAKKTWGDTGVLVDSRAASHVDVKWDGTHLFTVGAVQKATTTAADAIKFNRFSYVNGKYVADISAKTLNSGGVEAAVIAKDGHGRLWVAYTASKNVRYVTSDDDGTTFTNPTPLPFTAQSEGLDPDDIATVIGANDSASITWSRQGPAPSHIDGLYVATYKYSSSTGTAGAWTIDTLLDQAYASDDHINMSIDGDGAGRVFLVAKEGTNDNPAVQGTDTLIRLWVRSLNGQWNSYVVNQVADTVTRPIVVVDRDANLLRVFETGPEAGGVVYEKTTSLSNPSNFASGRGTPVLKLASDTFINNVTTTKQNVTKGTGLLLLASDQKTGRYVFNSDAVPVAPPPPAAAVRMTGPTSMYTTSRTVSAGWGTVDGSPMTSYDVNRTSAAYVGAVSAVSPWLTTTSGTSGSFAGSVGRTYCMAARGTNQAGSVSLYSAPRCTAVPLDERNLSRTKKWKAVSSGSYYLGTGMRTTSKGAAMSKTVLGKHVSLIVAKTRGGGSVYVYSGGRLVKRVSLAATRTLTKQFVPIASYTTARAATFRIVVVTRRKPVTIDGLAVSRN